MPEHLGDRLVRGDKGNWLDSLAKPFGAVVGGFYGLPATRWIKDILHGTWVLRHPLHPALTDVVVGAYAVVAVLDLIYLMDRDPSLVRATTIVLIVALLFALGSILSGLTDWNETRGNERRLGILHGALMALITIGNAASLKMRLDAGAQPTSFVADPGTLRWVVDPANLTVLDTAIYLSLAMFALLLVAAHLGGEMTYGFGTGVTRHAWARIPSKWQTVVLKAASLEDRKPARVSLRNGFDVMVVRMDGDLHAMAAVCTHAGGPLDEGKFVGSQRRDIECPWHFSVFSVKTGAALHGPATMDEPTFETRVAEDGNVEVRVRGPRPAAKAE
jgi:nitrite reductase/ring-hydroxylating ferredoxin subunit/uncharacterized membrane protein